ncbi:hypothetical protein ES703_49488 [subsurface metagenome]
MAQTIANVITGVAVLSIRCPAVDGGVWTEVGYTEDGVTMEYTADTADIEVEEETVPLERVITKETIAVTCNMAETSLYNIDKAIAGSIHAGAVLTIGGGVNKEMSIQIVGTTTHGGYTAVTILIPLATALGTVGMSYRKGEKTMVPVTFQALKGAAAPCTITFST